MTDQEKQQLFQMLAQGLMQYMAPAMQQFIGQSVGQGVAQGVRAGQTMAQEVVVNRLADESSAEDYVQQRTTPAQLLAEIADTLEIVREQNEDIQEKLADISKKVRRPRKTAG